MTLVHPCDTAMEEDVKWNSIRIHDLTVTDQAGGLCY